MALGSRQGPRRKRSVLGRELPGPKLGGSLGRLAAWLAASRHLATAAAAALALRTTAGRREPGGAG
eukprot:10194900-Alexandrium_andersonii.AAC.1